LTVAIVASQASMRSWRETRMLHVLLAGSVLGLSLMLFFGGKALLRHAAPATAATAAASHASGDDARYAGTFVVVPRGSPDCWRLMFDNRNGRLWGGGYVDCNVVTQTNENQVHQSMGWLRMQAIGNIFQK
jgi:hypothetical protein